jgi:hypothetical protein
VNFTTLNIMIQHYDKVDGSKTAPNGLYGIWDGDNP